MRFTHYLNSYEVNHLANMHAGLEIGSATYYSSCPTLLFQKFGHIFVVKLDYPFGQNNNIRAKT